MTSQPLPSSPTPAAAPATSNVFEIRVLLMLLLENEKAASQVLTNPDRVPIAGPAPTDMDTLLRGFAANKRIDLARAKALLLPDGMQCESISLRSMKVASRRKGPGLPIKDLRNNPKAAEAFAKNDAAICPELEDAIADPRIVGVFLDHHAFTAAWVVLLKPNAISMLSTDSRFRMTVAHHPYAPAELFEGQGRRVVRIAVKWTRVLVKLLLGLGGLVLLAGKVGLL